MIGVRIDVAENEHGRRVVVKRAETGDEAARLRREADLLDAATHPGLVELVSFDDGTEPVMRTIQVDGQSLDVAGAFAVEEVAGVAAAMASTLADLHAMGLVHGAVTPAHVVIDADGRPVLCGLGYGGLTGEPVLQRPVAVAEAGGAADPVMVDPVLVDSVVGDPVVLDPAVDVHGAGRVISYLLDRASGGSGEGLRAAAREATAADVASRPTARELADAAHDAVANPRLPRRGDVGPARPAGSFRPDPFEARRRQRPLEGWRRAQAPAPVARRRVRLMVTAAAAFGVVAAGGALVAWVRAPRSAAAPPRVVAAPEPTVVTTAQPVSEPTTLFVPARTTVVAARPAAPPAPAGCPVVEGPLAADVNGDGCPDAVRIVDGVVEAGGVRWSVGEPGDAMAVGDWSCTGARSLAVLRPSTGEVFAFTGWAAPGRDVQAPLVGTVAGGRSLRAADVDGDGCNELVVERPVGAPVVLRAPRAKP